MNEATNEPATGAEPPESPATVARATGTVPKTKPPPPRRPPTPAPKAAVENPRPANPRPANPPAEDENPLKIFGWDL
jgi:hypothetical protein